MLAPVVYNPASLSEIAAERVASLVTQEDQLLCMEIPSTLYPILVVKLHRYQEERQRLEKERLKEVREKKLQMIMRREKRILILLLIALSLSAGAAALPSVETVIIAGLETVTKALLVKVNHNESNTSNEAELKIAMEH